MAQQNALKRSGKIEPFAPGRVALAASRALRDAGEDGAGARDTGLAVAEKVLARAESIFGFNRPAPTDWIARAAREALEELGWPHARWAWENFERERGKGPQAYERRAWKIGEGADARELSWRQWEAALEQMSRALGHGWDGGQWARMALKAKPGLSQAADWESFFHAWAQAAKSSKKSDAAREAIAAALRAQSASSRVLGAAPLLAGAQACAAIARDRALDRWKAQRARVSDPWLSDEEAQALAEHIDPASDAGVSWARQEELERVAELESAHGGEAKLPCELFADAAFALFRRDKAPDRLQKTIRFLQLQSQGAIQLPARSLARALGPRETFCPNWALDAGSTPEDAARALAQATEFLGNGAGAAIDLSSLPASGNGAGGPADWARALAGASRGVGAGEKKARVWLEPWHSDFFLFLKGAAGPEGLGASHGVWASDVLARRAIEGGDWVLVDPRDYTKLSQAFGEEFAFWIDQAVAWIREGKLKGRILPAKEVWGAIAEAMASGAPVALAFKEPLAGLRKKGERLVASASAHWALPASPGEPMGSPEGTIDWGAINSEEEGRFASELLVRALDNAIDGEPGLLKTPIAAQMRPLAMGAARLPARAKKTGDTLALTAQKAGWAARDGSAQIALERGAFSGAEKSYWSKEDPWADRAERLREQRGGYWGQDSVEPAPPGGLPRNASLLALGEPEAGIERALAGEILEGDEPGKLRQQLDWAAIAQTGVDQGVAVELKLGALNGQDVGQALQMAWLRGVRSASAWRDKALVDGDKRVGDRRKRKPRASKANRAQSVAESLAIAQSLVAADEAREEKAGSVQ